MSVWSLKKTAKTHNKFSIHCPYSYFVYLFSHSVCEFKNNKILLLGMESVYCKFNCINTVFLHGSL